MKKLYKLFALALFAFLIGNIILYTDNCSAQWVQTSGPCEGTGINSYSIAGTTIFCGTAGVYRSSNNGTNWISVNNGLPYQGIASLASLGSYTFAGMDSGVFRTSNNGMSWDYSNNGLIGTVRDFAISGTNIYAGTDFGVFLSSNNGNNWTSIGMPGHYIRSLLVSSSNIYAGTRDGVYLSTNNGGNWNCIGLTYYYINSLSISGVNLYAGTESSGVMLYSNSGSNWVSVNNGLTNLHVNTLEVYETNIYIGTDSGIYRSTNSGYYWIAMNSGLKNLNINAIAISGTNIFAGTNKGNYVSLNNGSNWTEINNGFTIVSISCLGDLGSKLYAGKGKYNLYGNLRGLYCSSNNGDSWYSIDTNRTYYTFVKSGAKLYAGAYNGVYTTDSTGWWYSLNLSNHDVYSIASSDNSIVAGCYYDGIYLSTNNGQNWINTNFPYSYPHYVAISGTNIYANAYYNSSDKIFKTTNNGTNWTQLSLSVDNIISLLASGSNILAGTVTGYYNSANLYLSTNDGANWNGALGQKAYSLTNSGNIIIAGTDNGVYVSTNNGSHWTQRSQGLNNNRVLSVNISNGYVFAGTDTSSVWRRPYSETIGIRNINSNIPDKYSLSQNYPNPFNPNTIIRFQIKDARFVSLKVYDILGKEIETIVNEKLKAGIYETTFNGSNYPSGIYFYKLMMDNFSETKKMTLLK
jgi:hypothetical protein